MNHGWLKLKIESDIMIPCDYNEQIFDPGCNTCNIDNPDKIVIKYKWNDGQIIILPVHMIILYAQYIEKK